MTTAAAPPMERRVPRLAGLRAVLERDFLVFTSRPRFILLRTLAVALPTALFMTVLVTASDRSSIAGDSSAIGHAVYAASLALLPSLVMLLAPIVASSCIASERALNTLQIVLATPVSPTAFVFAKFASRLGVVLVLFFATLPLAGLCFLYGGVAGGAFFEFVAFVVGVAVLGTASGILASAWSRSVAAAAFHSYTLSIGIPLAHLMAIALSAASPQRFFSPGAGWVAGANPFRAWSLLGLSTLSGVTNEHPGWTFLAWACGAAVAAIAVAGRRVARESGHETARASSGRSCAPIRFENPVVDRAMRGTLLNRPRFAAWGRLVFLVLGDALILFLAAKNHAVKESWPHMVFLGAITLCVALAALTTGANSIATERQTGALDMLLATRLGARDIVGGKCAGCLAVVAPHLGLGLVHGAVAAVGTELRGLTVLSWFVSATVLATLCSAVGIRISAAASTAGRAVLLSFSVLNGGTVLHGVVVAIAAMLARFTGDEFMFYLMGPSPLYLAVFPIGQAQQNHWSNSERHGFIACAVWLFIYVLVSLVLVRSAVRALSRRRETS